MKIAILTNNQKPLPSPKDSMYSPNLVASDITEELVARGHEVYLFSGKDSVTKANLCSGDIFTNYHDNSDLQKEDPLKYQQLGVQYELFLISKALELTKQHKFDVIHAHDQNLLPYFSNLIDTPIVFTYHANILFDMKFEIIRKRFQKFYTQNFYVAISQWQKKQSEKYLNVVDVVNHGINIKKYEFSDHPQDHILFLGRLIETKGPDLAIEIALKLQKRVYLGGDIGQETDNQIFWNKKLKPLANNKLVKFLGHIPFDKTNKLYGEAKLFILPIRWDEPFGLVMIEAMACGTPVVAFNRGSVPEVIKNGETGFICPPGDINCMVKAVKKIYEMPEDEYQKMRLVCRKYVEDNFTVEKMVDGYEKVYQKVINDWRGRDEKK